MRGTRITSPRAAPSTETGKRRFSGLDASPSAYACPRCHGSFVGAAESLRCEACSLTFPVEDGIADFSEGDRYDSFREGDQLPAEALEGLKNEALGAAARIDIFYRPLLVRRVNPGRGRPIRVLDSGCGNGISVDILQQNGFEAWGSDLSPLRKWQWRERQGRNRLALADSGRLPFPDGFFDAVLSSGVLEHIGVREQRDPRYRVEPLPEKNAARESFLAEQWRVLGPGGILFLDFPNGAFPFDFWHGDRPGQARFHGQNEGFLPTFKEVETLFRRIDPHARVCAVSPRGRLAFRQVGRHWYGRIFRVPFQSLFAFFSIPGGRIFARTAVNPYLVLEVRR